MIRRDWPLGNESSDQWLLISQPEHARLSWELAKAWGNEQYEPIVCPNAGNHPLAQVREEVLQAIRRHDDGWLGYADHPAHDEEKARPYNFTEMPPHLAQELWDGSIGVCRDIGPLAGWMVASHFVALQADPDEDYADWAPWLEHVNQECDDWLAEWLATDDRHTPELAGRSLFWLQAFDWMSLWLCCYAPLNEGDSACEPLQIGGAETTWPRIRFVPQGNSKRAGHCQLSVDPWPFAGSEFQLQAIGRLASKQGGGQSSTIELHWEFSPV